VIALTIIPLALGAVGAVWDILQRRIPNWLCAIFALACATRLAWLDGWEALGSGGLHALIALAIGMVLFRFGWFGGGDAKFYSAAALGTPLAGAVDLLFWTAMGGLVLVVVFGLLRLAIRKRDKEKAKKLAILPYGVAISIGYTVSVIPSLTV
jgi:prepilin peptidase CpaA